MISEFDTAPYFAAFQLLVRDLHRLLEHVEPSDANGATYSHRIYELLLRVCTEFESLCRDIVVASKWNEKKREDLRGGDYRKLAHDRKLTQYNVTLLFWRPKPRLVSPFEEWKAPEGRLPWYADYNAAKHDRNAEFARANLVALTDAFAGLFELLALVDGDGFHAGITMHLTHWHFFNDEFDLRCDGTL